MAKRYHPDKHPEDKQEWAHTKFKELSEAYNVLRHPELRKKYDFRRLKQPGGHQDHVSSYEYISDREKAYFYYRTGQKYFERTYKKVLSCHYSGRREDDLLVAENNFLEVIQSYPQTPITESANSYYFYCLVRKFDYTTRHREKVEREYDFLKRNYRNGKWAYQDDLEMARFHLLKGFQPQRSVGILQDLLNQPISNEMKVETEILLVCALQEIQ